jgi:hypothetical protein
MALKPEMYADVLLETSLPDVVAVPDAAVLSTGTRSIVFVVKEDGAFEPREVQVGTKTGGYWEVRRGLEAGEKVITQANFLIDSESRLKAALAGLAPPPGGHEHGAAPPAPAGGSAERKAPSPARVAPSPKRPDPHAGHETPAPPTPDHSGHSN